MTDVKEAGILSRLSKGLGWLVLLVAATFLGTYVVLAFLRMPYPFELEWMEGGSVDHVRRILSDRPLYARPCLEFIAYIYPPLYYCVCAVVAKLIGVGFLPLRLVSFLCSIGCFLIIFLIVRRETKDVFSSVLAMCLFAAAFRRCGAFFDVARVDSQCLFLTLLAVYHVRFGASWGAYALAGVFLSLACLTKQTALIVGAPLVIYGVLTNWRRSLVFIAVVAAIVAGGTLVLDHVSGGWYGYYTRVLPQRHTFLTGAWMEVLTGDILAPLPIATVMAAFYVYRCFSCRFARTALFYPMMLMAMLGAAVAGRLNLGGYYNALFPGYAILAIVFGLAAHEFIELIGGSRALDRPVRRIVLHAACLAQFGLLAYNPLLQVPSRDDRAAGQGLVEAVRKIEGEVFIPFHVDLASQAGKATCAQLVAMQDVLGVFGDNTVDEIGWGLIQETREAIRGGRFGVVILDGASFPWLEEELPIYYVPAQKAFERGDVFWPVTGFRTRPERIYVLRR